MSDRIPLNTDELTLADLKILEREIILRALNASNWKVYGPDGAAARLDLPPTTLASRMKKMNIRRPQNGAAVIDR